MRKYILIVLLAALTGCSNQTLNIKIRPMILDSIHWNEYLRKPHFEYARKVYKEAGINLTFLKAVYYEGPTSVLGIEQWNTICDESEQHVFKTSEIPIWLVDEIRIYPDSRYMGYATIFGPTSPKYGIIISRHCELNTVAHEIGHQLGLQHSFDLNEDDPDFCNMIECDDSCCALNIMSYCKALATNKSEYKMSLTPNQIAYIKRIATTYQPYILH